MMKSQVTNFLLVFLLSMTVFAQAPTDPLAALIAQNAKEVDQLTAQRKAMLKLPGDRYLAALDSVDPIVARSGSAVLAAALERERAAVLNASEISTKPGGDLPAQVLSSRRDYVSAAQRVTSLLTASAQAQREQYFRQLAKIEAQAFSQKDQPLLARVAEEKQKAVAQAADSTAPASGFGKNLLRNGDFALPPSSAGAPHEWEDSDGGAIIQMENTNAFLRLQGKSISQLVILPAEVKSVRVEARMRAPDFKELPLPGKHYAGLRLLFQDAKGGHLAHFHIGEITKPQRAWKAATETIKAPTGSARVQVVIFREGIDGALDADNLSLEAMNR